MATSSQVGKRPEKMCDPTKVNSPVTTSQAAREEETALVIGKLPSPPPELAAPSVALRVGRAAARHGQAVREALLVLVAPVVGEGDVEVGADVEDDNNSFEEMEYQ
jgi:hypothetical protein